MRILKMTIKRHWLDLIIAGKKVTEYRKNRIHWRSRLLDNEGNQREYDEIHLFNGRYCGYDLPHVKLKYNGWDYAGKVPPKNNEPGVLGCDFAIDVSEIIEVNV